MRYRLIIPVFRSPHPPAYTARGVANGVFWGLTPTVGLQTFEILGTWLVARRVLHRDSSLLQAMVWVWVNNPLTMVPLYYAFYLTGLWLIGDIGAATGYDAFAAILDNRDGRRVERMVALVGGIGVPLMVGCLPYALAGAALSYRWALRVAVVRKARIARRRPA